MASMDRKTFQKILSKHFYPTLRAQGFRGSGATLRRIDGDLLHLFNFQGSSGGEGFYVNLGVHIASLGGPPLDKALEHNCAFRQRMDPLRDTAGRRWPYGSSEADAMAVIEELAAQSGTIANQFFANYATYPGSFLQLVEGTDAHSLNPYKALTYAKIALNLGKRERALEIAEEAIPRVRAKATGLIANLRQFVDEIGMG